MKTFNKTLLLIITIATISPFSAYAASSPSYTLLEPLPCIPGNGVTCGEAGNGTAGTMMTSVEFKNYVQYIFNLAIAIAAAGAVFMIVFGGFQYMTTDSWSEKSEGLKKVKNALFGLLIVLTSYLILRTIDPRLVAIPTTLVEPLHIATSTANSDLLNLIGSDLASLEDRIRNAQGQSRIIYQQAQTDLNDIRTEMPAILARKAAAENAVRQAGASLGLTDPEQICRTNDTPTPISEDLISACADYRREVQELNTARAVFIIAQARVEMTQELQSCLNVQAYNAGVFNQCIADINTTQAEKDREVQALNMPTLDIDDYASYLKAMLKITLAMLDYNPSMLAFIGQATGSYVANGPIKSAFIDSFFPAAGLVLNTANWVTPANKTPGSTITQIRNIVAQAGIGDPTLKADLDRVAQSYLGLLTR